MTLDEFIAIKPACLRLWQFFVNTYYKKSDNISQTLYYLEDDNRSQMFIIGLMMAWQWTELPDIG